MDVQITINATPEEARAELARWLDSGEYLQTRGVLCRIDEEGSPSFCCLGVASEIGAALGLINRIVGTHGEVDYEGEHAVLGPVLQKFFGMTSTGNLAGVARNVYYDYIPETHFIDAPGEPELTGYNDRIGATFHVIAEVVRNGEFVRPPGAIDR